MIPEEVCIVKGETMENSPFSACSEILTGSLTMLGLAGGAPDLRVVVKVYRTSLEHFAVVYPDKVICKPIGYVNLKNCTVECPRTNGRTFQVVRRSCDGGVLAFRAEFPKDVKLWTNALRVPDQNTGRVCSPHRKSTDSSSWQMNVSLPIVEEGDEE